MHFFVAELEESVGNLKWVTVMITIGSRCTPSPCPPFKIGWVGEDMEAALVNQSPTVSSCSTSFKASTLLD